MAPVSLPQEQELAIRTAELPCAKSQGYRRGLMAALPIMLGLIPVGLVLGAQATQKGFSTLEVPLLTGLNFGGASELAMIAVWTSPAHVLLLMAIAFLVNSRHILMGAILSPFIKHLPTRQVLALLFFMTDESWAMGLADARARIKAHNIPLKNALNIPYFLGIGTGLYFTWVSATFLGAVAGPLVGDLQQWGFHMAFPAVFLVLLRGMWRGLPSARPWLVSLIVGCVCYLCIPGAWYVAIGALSGMASAWWWAPQGEQA